MFRLEITTDNDAFTDDCRYEIAQLLRIAADRVSGGASDGRLLDVNGNHVGDFSLDT